MKFLKFIKLPGDSEPCDTCLQAKSISAFLPWFGWAPFNQVYPGIPYKKYLRLDISWNFPETSWSGTAYFVLNQYNGSLVSSSSPTAFPAQSYVSPSASVSRTETGLSYSWEGSFGTHTLTYTLSQPYEVEDLEANCDALLALLDLNDIDWSSLVDGVFAAKGIRYVSAPLNEFGFDIDGLPIYDHCYDAENFVEETAEIIDTTNGLVAAATGPDTSTDIQQHVHSSMEKKLISIRTPASICLEQVDTPVFSPGSAVTSYSDFEIADANICSGQVIEAPTVDWRATPRPYQSRITAHLNSVAAASSCEDLP